MNQPLYSDQRRIGRDRAIDIVRGLCIVSMIASHLAAGSFLDKVSHPSVWVDGASGFVLFSGLLIGIVQRSTRERCGTAEGIYKLSKRIGIVYLGHLWLCLVCFSVVAVAPARDDLLPSVADQGGLGPAILRTLTLQINPYFTSILSMYVVLMICTFATLWLLERKLHSVLIACLAILVIFGTAFPSWAVLPREVGIPGPITLTNWFVLMTVGVVTGWYWTTPQVRATMTSRALMVGATVVALIGILGARALNKVAPEFAVAALDVVFTKDGMGPGRIVVSLCSYFVLYRVLTWLLGYRFWVRLLAPIDVVGRRSLDSYLILSSIVLALPAVWQWEQASPIAILLAAAVLSLCVAWAAARPKRLRLPPRPRATSAGSSDPVSPVDDLHTQPDHPSRTSEVN